MNMEQKKKTTEAAGEPANHTGSGNCFPKSLSISTMLQLGTVVKNTMQHQLLLMSQNLIFTRCHGVFLTSNRSQ